MKLNEQVFNAVLEQVRNEGPDEDCQVPVDDAHYPMTTENEVFMALLEQGAAQTLISPTIAIHAAFHLGFETALQYVKVSKEVIELERLAKA